MGGIIINIDPVIMQIGHFSLRWYSVFVLLAVVTAIWLALRLAKEKGIAANEMYNLAPWVLIAGMVGARLFHVFDQWEYYAGNPLSIFQVQQGGLAIWGALAGGGLAAINYAWLRHIPLGRLADTLVIPVLAAQIIGRMACIVNGDAYGGITSLPWAFIYIHPDAMIPANLVGVPTHPYPVYEMLWNGAILLVMLKLRRRFSKDGALFLSYLSLYSVGRFILTFVRQENAILWGLQQAQILAIAILIASVSWLIYVLRKAEHRIPAEKGVSNF